MGKIRDDENDVIFSKIRAVKKRRSVESFTFRDVLYPRACGAAVSKGYATGCYAATWAATAGPASTPRCASTPQEWGGRGAGVEEPYLRWFDPAS